MKSLSSLSLFLIIVLLQLFMAFSTQEFLRNERKSSLLFETDHNQKLSSNSLAVFSVLDVLECSWKCLKHYSCWSFNIAGKSVNDFLDCELFSTTKYRVPLKFSNKHIHYTIKDICKSNPCEDGRVCSVLDEIQYNCKCNSSYTGNNCEFQTPTCLSAKDGQFGVFETAISGQVKFFKLVHVSGGLSRAQSLGTSNWGTAVRSYNEIEVVITSVDDKFLTPPAASIGQQKFYTLPGVKVNDSELTFPGFEPPLEVVTGQKFRVWYMEDLLNNYEVDNHGRLCVYVHVHFHS